MGETPRDFSLGFGIVLVGTFAAVGGGVTYLLWDLVDFSGAQFGRAAPAPSAPPSAVVYAAEAPTASPPAPARRPAASPSGGASPAPAAQSPPQSELKFAPPSPDDAPDDMRGSVTLGLQIVSETHKYAGQFVGNKLDCSSCHADGGASKDSLPLVGVAARFPSYDEQAGAVIDLAQAVNACFERNLSGKPLPSGSKEMLGVLSYLHWISKGIPIYAEVPWLTLQEPQGGQSADPAKGKALFATRCGACHGMNGEGTVIGPPLWGPDSYSDGSAMAQGATAAAYIKSFMPKGAPTLSGQQALDLGAYIVAQTRPKFEAGSAP